ncbi:MAG TPA: hypothetical protein VFR24_27315 [Candidatus Angelobacter sp.]|nr:hypothetical protein [Candidatus Angelobacter sp.]
MFLIGLVLGALIASAAWWIELRSLHGVISDLKNVQSEAQKAVDQVKK